jgi:hypothetical protein
VLLAIIPLAWLAVASLGLGACRLAALSDASNASALRKWIAETAFPAASSDSAERGAAQSPRDLRDQRFRATG